MVKKRITNYITNMWELYLFILPALILIIIFQYVPIYGLQIAFKKFSLSAGFYGGEFCGLDNFKRFFNVFNCWQIIVNTLTLSIARLVFEFPLPLLLAILLNQVNNEKFKKLTQTVTYAPYLISIVVIAGMLYVFLAPNTGIVNVFIKLLGGEPVFFIGEKDWVQPLYVLTDIWQNTGFSAVIYIAALSTIDLGQIEAATIDGVNKLQKILYIDLPSIMPTVIIILVLNIGKMLQIGFEKMLLLQNSMNIERAEIISTYVYRAGIIEGNYSFGAAVGILNSVVNVLLLLAANCAAKKLSESSLF